MRTSGIKLQVTVLIKSIAAEKGEHTLTGMDIKAIADVWVWSALTLKLKSLSFGLILCLFKV